MLKIWQKKQILNYKGKYKEIMDIVQFGSSVIEKKEPNDIDIAIFFEHISLKEQLLKAQKIKIEMQKYSPLMLHVKSFDFLSFFDKGNFAREGILFYGKSLLTNDYFAKTFRLLPRIQIYYSFEDMAKKEKVRFHYMLKGKKNNSGLLNKYSGVLLKPGLIEIKPEHEKIFLDKIKEFSVSHFIKKVLIEIKE
ncbi:MAG: hypothetical protein QXR96_02855 [Candidatus Woesearchaeota archaeon]